MKVEQRQGSRSAVYFNGLNSGEETGFNRILFRRLAQNGIDTTHANVDWFTLDSPTEVLDGMVDITKQQLRKTGRVTLIGVSAGGSMALNIFEKVRAEDRKLGRPGSDLLAVLLSSRLREGDIDLPPRQRLTERASMYKSNGKTSPLFLNSVREAEKAAERLTEEDKSRIIPVVPLYDRIVPLSTQGIRGVKSELVLVRGHHVSLVAGALKLPGIINRLESGSVKIRP